MIRSTCSFLAGVTALVALGACAASGEPDEDKRKTSTSGGSSGAGNNTGFGGTTPGVGGTGQGGSGFAGTGQGGSGFGGTGQGGAGFGGSSGAGFGGSSGASGGSSGAGFGGSSGAGTAGTGAGGAPGTIDLIDDMELGTGSIPSNKGRVGAWYTYNDGTTAGTQTPTAGMPFVIDAMGYMGKCARTNGSGFVTWGAGMGVDLKNTGTGPKGTYDASGAQGITFYAKGTPFRIKVQIPATIPTSAGGTCTGVGCDNSHGALVAATANWTSFQVPFSSLMQETWAEMNPAQFTPASIVGIQFQVPKDTAFDFAIDNLAFY